MACAAPSNGQTSYLMPHLMRLTTLFMVARHLQLLHAQWSFDDIFSFPFIFSLQP
jgi:ABC-type uncharacterized transport system substrate-binding protein